MNFARGETIDRMFAMAGDSSHDLGFGDSELPLGYLETRHGKDIVASHVEARRMLAASLEGRREQEDVLLRLHSSGAVWKNLADASCPETNEARLALLDK